METSAKIVLYSISLMVLLVLGITAWQYPITKNYTFLVEASCTPGSLNCFHRDCSAALSDCPPNNFADYEVFTLKAADFSKCADGTCAKECTSHEIQCTQLVCGGDSGVSCQSDPEANAQ